MSNGTPGKMVKGLVVAGALLMASGCQMLQSMMPAGDEEMPRVREGTLAALPATETRQVQGIEAGSGPTDDVSIETVMESYKALLPLVDDPRKQVTIRHRLADLEFQRAERKMADTGSPNRGTAGPEYPEYRVAGASRPEAPRPWQADNRSCHCPRAPGIRTEDAGRPR